MALEEVAQTYIIQYQYLRKRQTMPSQQCTSILHNYRYVLSEEEMALDSFYFMRN